MRLQTLADQHAARTAAADARRLRSAADSGLGNDRFLAPEQAAALRACKAAAERLASAARIAREALADLEATERRIEAERLAVRVAVADLEQASKAADLARERAQQEDAL